MPKLPRISGRQAVKVLEKAGWGGPQACASAWRTCGPLAYSYCPNSRPASYIATMFCGGTSG